MGIAGNYGEQLAGKAEVASLCGAVRDALDATEVRAMAFREQFLRFSHLWTKQPSVSLQVHYLRPRFPPCTPSWRCMLYISAQVFNTHLQICACAVMMQDQTSSTPFICLSTLFSKIHHTSKFPATSQINRFVSLTRRD